jgi:hypothetical protein
MAHTLNLSDTERSEVLAALLYQCDNYRRISHLNTDARDRMGTVLKLIDAVVSLSDQKSAQ